MRRSRALARRRQPEAEDARSPSFGESLGDVRVHTREGAAALARASARAFTVGNDVFFASGEYPPGSRDGNGLIAHEAGITAQVRDRARIRA